MTPNTSWLVAFWFGCLLGLAATAGNTRWLVAIAFVALLVAVVLVAALFLEGWDARRDARRRNMARRIR